VDVQRCHTFLPNCEMARHTTTDHHQLHGTTRTDFTTTFASGRLPHPHLYQQDFRFPAGLRTCHHSPTTTVVCWLVALVDATTCGRFYTFASVPYSTPQAAGGWTARTRLRYDEPVTHIDVFAASTRALPHLPFWLDGRTTPHYRTAPLTPPRPCLTGDSPNAAVTTTTGRTTRHPTPCLPPSPQPTAVVDGWHDSRARQPHPRTVDDGIVSDTQYLAFMTTVTSQVGRCIVHRTIFPLDLDCRPRVRGGTAGVFRLQHTEH